MANRLFESGYLESAEKDYNKILTAYADGTPGIDEAWLGLAKVHQAKGETAKARASLQEVLRRDSAAIAATDARNRYRTLRSEAELELNEARRAVMYYEARHRGGSWWNPFGKLFSWLDLRKARKHYSKLAKDLGNYDPHFLVDPIAKPSAQASVDAHASANPGTTGTNAGDYRLTPEEMAALLRSQGGSPLPVSDGQGTGSSTATLGSDGTATSSDDAASVEVGGGTGTASAGTGGPPVVQASTGTGTDDLESVQKTYFASYQALREALSSGDATKIQEATAAYQAAKGSYERAKLSQVGGS
jgi:tetratricopeptide (TPR) repeat protein